MSDTRPQSCNVLELGASGGKVWRFDTGGNKIEAAGELKAAVGSTFPSAAIGKNWQHLWQPRMNIAWVSPRRVFLRVAQFPASSFEELLSMVELQLEKLSPLPVNQCLWSVEPVLHSRNAEGMQTVVVLIAARSEVDKVLGEAEGHGYFTDRLEVPFLHQLLQSPPKSDGAWLYPYSDDTGAYALTAWWFDGRLCNLSLLHFSTEENWGAELGAEVSRIAWAGELEGWLNSVPHWNLVADPELARVWGPILSHHSDHPVQVVNPPTSDLLASLSASRASAAQSHANLLPEDFKGRYRQEFIDRLWMRGLVAVVVVYLIGVVIYIGGVQVLKFQKNQLDKEIAGIKQEYGRAVELKARNRILSEQINLRFAALDSWKVATEKLPTELTLSSLVFQRGKRILLSGSASADDLAKITEYNESLSKYQSNGRSYFADVSPPSSRQEGSGPGGRWSWSFSCELRNNEEP